MTWGKSDAERLEQTLQFIRTAPALPNAAEARRGSVARNIERYLHRNPEHKDNFSRAMSQKHAPGRPGTETERSYRRAMILIRIVLYSTDTPGAVASTVNGNPGNATEFGATLETGFKNCTRNLDERYEALVANTRRFMTEENFKIFGTQAAGPRDYAFYYDTNQKLYVLQPSLEMAESSLRKLKTIRATQIPATNWHTFARRGSFAGVIPPTVLDAGGPPLALTTQFTGCSFCYAPNLPQIIVAHVAPDGTNSDTSKKYDGVVLSQDLRRNGSFAGYRNAMRVYARGDGDPMNGYPRELPRMFIVCVRRPTGWRFYSQHWHSMDRREVYRIFP